MENLVDKASKFATVASAVSGVLVVAQLFIPQAVKDYAKGCGTAVSEYFDRYEELVIERTSESTVNNIYEDAIVYLPCVRNIQKSQTGLFKHVDDVDYTELLREGARVFDLFDGVAINWVFCCEETKYKSETSSRKHQYLKVRIPKVAFTRILPPYIAFVSQQARSIRQRAKHLKIFSLDAYKDWDSRNFTHPSTFETLALDPEVKRGIIQGLDDFVRRGDYYRKIGKVWRKGYLLYGPPGTGKTSLIGAMANHLRFNVYMLDIASLTDNYQLEHCLRDTSNESIIVVEDIDCSIDFANRSTKEKQSSDSKVTLSCLLNVLDGLESSCGEKKIVVFTTNHKEKLDPAMIRPGRMDEHIHMSYCTPGAFEVLASNYLSITTHELFKEIKELIMEVEVTPAVVAQKLMVNESVDKVLEDLVEFLGAKKLKKEEI